MSKILSFAIYHKCGTNVLEGLALYFSGMNIVNFNTERKSNEKRPTRLSIRLRRFALVIKVRDHVTSIPSQLL